MKRSGGMTGLFIALWGTLALLNSLGKPRVAALHTTDILGLIGCGMCFGVALVGLIAGPPWEKLRARFSTRKSGENVR